MMKQTRWNRKRHKLNTSHSRRSKQRTYTQNLSDASYMHIDNNNTTILYCRLPFTYDLPERLTQYRAVHMFKRKVFALSITKSIYNKFHVFLSIWIVSRISFHSLKHKINILTDIYSTTLLQYFRWIATMNSLFDFDIQIYSKNEYILF